MLKKYKNKLRYFLGQYYFLFGPIYRTLAPKTHQKLIFNKDTEIVIEGFPRSANTFSVVFFELLQDKPVKVAHHLHVECQLIFAAKTGVPAILLIREPISAIESLLKRHPSVKVRAALKRYIKFYSNLKKYKNKFVVADFSLITSNMPVIIKSVNEKYGVSFNEGDHNEGFVEKVFEEIDNINNNIDGGLETHVARPSKMRKQMKIDFDFDSHIKLVKRAEGIYKEFLEN